MAKKRKTSKRRNNKEIDSDIAVILLIVLGIVSCIVLYFNGGSVGEVISPFLGGCLGKIKYIIPIAIFGAAYAIARDNGTFIKSKIFQILLLLGFIASCLNIYQISNGNIDKSKGFDTVIQAAYELGVSNKGGGTIGAVIAYPLVSLFSEFGAAVISLGFSVILIVFTFGVSPSLWLLELQERLEENRELRKEEIEEKRARIEERRKNRKVVDIPIDNDKEEERIRKSSKIKDFTKDELVLQEDQIKMDLSELEEKEQSKREGKIKGLFRHSDKTAEIIEKENNLNNQNKKEKDNPNELTGLFIKQAVEKEEKTQEILQLEHNTTSEDDENYEFPPIELMKEGNKKMSKGGNKALSETALKLQKTLHSFGVAAKVENYSVGPAITRFELKPAEGVRVSKIAKLSDDIALNLAAETIRIEAPIPGKQAVRY